MNKVIKLILSFRGKRRKERRGISILDFIGLRFLTFVRNDKIPNPKSGKKEKGRMTGDGCIFGTR